MTIRNLGLGALIVASCVIWLAFTGCSDPNKPEQKPEDIVNPDKPNSNARIISHTAIGDASKWTTVSEITKSNTGGYYFRGGYNSQYVGGRLSAGGSVTWQCRTHYWPRDLYTTAQTAVVPNALIVVGAYDNDSDGTMDTGYLSLVSASGRLLDQLVYSSDASDIWLTSIVPASDSTFVAVGGVKTSTATYPFFVLAKLASSGQLEKQSEVTISSLPDQYFGYAVRDPDASSATEITMYVNSGPDVTAVHKLSLSLPTLNPWTVDWSREITVPSIQESWVNGLCFFDGNLYVVGGVRDLGKTPDSNGDYWTSAMVASFTSAGDSRWVKVVRVTEHSDLFKSVAVSSDGVFALGECAEFLRQDQEFGYGWISKLTASTGGVVSNSTFGDLKYRSGFNNGIVDGGVIHCVGWTQHEVADVYRGWFCDVDISGLAAESPSIVPARIGVDDQVIIVDRPGETGGGR